MMNEKVHFKLYKSGKKWLVAAIGVATLSVGLSQAPGVKADTVSEGQSSADSSQTTSSSSSSNVVPLKSGTQTTQTSGSNNTEETNSSVTASSETDKKSENENASSSSISTKTGGTVTTQNDSSNQDNHVDTSSNLSTNDDTTSNETDAGDTAGKSTGTETKQSLMRSTRTFVAEGASLTDNAVTTQASPTMPAVVNDADAKAPTATDNHPVNSQVTITATNAQGTVTSNPSTYVKSSGSVTDLVDQNATNLTVNYTLKNTTDTSQAVNPEFTLPKNANRNDAQWLLSDDVSEDTFTKNVPTNFVVKYTADGWNFYTWDEIKSKNIKMSDIIGFRTDGNLAANAEFTVSVPLVAANTVTGNNNTTVSILGMGSNVSDTSLQYQTVEPVKVDGQLRAVTLVSAGNSSTPAVYAQASAAVQSQMPDLSSIKYTVLNNNKQASSYTNLYAGNYIQINLDSTGLSNIARQNGYIVTPYTTTQTYELGGNLTPTVTGTDETATNYAPYVYVVLQEVFTTKNLNLLGGDSWNSLDNLVTAKDYNGKNMDTNKITVTVNDPNGIIKNGTAVKNGTFTVTYAANVLWQDVTAMATVTVSGAQTVNFVDSKGTVVGTTGVSTRDGNVQNISSHVPANYRLASGVSGDITVTGSGTPIVVNVVLDEQTYTVNFIDQFGKVVGTTTATGINGDQSDVTKALPAGYVLDDGVDGNLTLTGSTAAPITVQVVNSNALANADSPIPAITNDPNGVADTVTDAIIATGQLSATNKQGTSLSQTTNYTNGGAIIDANATSIAAVFRLSNTTSAAIQDDDLARFYLPRNNDSNSNYTQLTLADGTSEKAFEDNLPEGLTVTYSLDGYNFYSWQALQAMNANLQNIKAFQVGGTIAANSAHTFTLPLKVLKADYYKLSGVDYIGATSEPGVINRWRRLPFRLAKSEDVNMTGQYEAVTVIKLGLEYQQAPADIQALMPSVKDGDVTYYNFFNTNGAKSSKHTYSGGITVVNLANIDFADLVKSHGYTLLLNTDSSGTPQTVYSYQSYEDSAGVQVIGNGEGDGTQLAPAIYITLRKVVSTQDQSLKVGDDWQPLSGLASVKSNDDQLSSATDVANDVTVTLNDPAGIVENGKVVKTGTFTVTYSYQVADNYNGKGEPYVVSNTATITVNGDYVVNFVDPADPNTVLATTTLTDQMADGTVDVTKFKPTGYDFVQGENGSVTLSNDPSTPITLNVVKTAKQYTINYVNADGTVLKTVTATGSLAEQLDLSTDKPADYSLVDPTSADVTLTEASVQAFNVPVEKTQHSYTIQINDVDGTNLSTLTLDGTNGETVDLTKNIPADYQLATGYSASVTLNDPETAKVIKVERVSKTYTVNFVNAQNQTVKTVTFSGKTGERLSVAKDVPTDYQLATGVTGQLTLAQDAQTPMTVNVDRLQKTYTVNFVDAQNQIIKTVTFSGTTGENKDVTTDIPAGYQLAAGVSAQLTLAMDATKPMTIQLSAKSAASQGSQATSDSSTASQPSSVASQATSDQSTASQPSSVASQATSDQSTASQPGSVASQATSDSSTASQPSSVASQTAGNLVTTSQACPVTSNQPMMVSHQANLQGLQVSRREIMSSGSAQPQNVSQVSSQAQRAVSVKAAQAAVITKSGTKSQAQPATARQRAMSLPQTDERTSSLAVSLGLTALAGLLGLAGLVKKERR
ncbi:LPXTG cell wall anchor domain-containing protein [Lactiplantibacillus garii]|uniref:LPXTG cell wall anchor domain-containing protein n=1 Tax=Lactiplantibacillus garii TaxID=2306423 RepID=A0A426D620_9LACO|nr:KxYKxGKxW signal peptide domain-containing protein [Lactiplantibacillus garii]RRK10011.1 LPXTG cell wall anchor domain-containing protein [Lactiplantibacillus garii]